MKYINTDIIAKSQEELQDMVNILVDTTLEGVRHGNQHNLNIGNPSTQKKVFVAE